MQEQRKPHCPSQRPSDPRRNCLRADIHVPCPADLRIWTGGQGPRGGGRRGHLLRVRDLGRDDSESDDANAASNMHCSLSQTSPPTSTMHTTVPPQAPTGGTTMTPTASQVGPAHTPVPVRPSPALPSRISPSQSPMKRRPSRRCHDATRSLKSRWMYP